MIARECGVAQSTVSKINKRLRQFCEDRQQQTRSAARSGVSLSLNQLRDVVKEKRRGGGEKLRKLGGVPEHERVVRESFEKNPALTLEEISTILWHRCGVRVHLSTVCRFVNNVVCLSRKRLQRALPKQALTEKNARWRVDFVKKGEILMDFEL